MAEKEQKDKDKEAVEKLKADYEAQDMGTYMDARVDGKPVRVAVWDEAFKTYKPTEEGLALLNTPKPEKAPAKPAAKPAASGAGAGIATPVPPAPPPGQGPTAVPAGTHPGPTAPPPAPPPPGTKPAG